MHTCIYIPLLSNSGQVHARRIRFGNAADFCFNDYCYCRACRQAAAGIKATTLRTGSSLRRPARATRPHICTYTKVSPNDGIINSLAQRPRAGCVVFMLPLLINGLRITHARGRVRYCAPVYARVHCFCIPPAALIICHTSWDWRAKHNVDHYVDYGFLCERSFGSLVRRRRRRPQQQRATLLSPVDLWAAILNPENVDVDAWMTQLHRHTRLFASRSGSLA